jgi:hypothetical protein
VKRGASYTTLVIVTFGILCLLIGVVIVALAIEPLRAQAFGYAGLLFVAYVVMATLRRQELRRVVAQLKAEHGGALPIPYPRRARVLIASFSGTFALVGLIALVFGLVESGVERLFLIVFGSSVLLVAGIFALNGWRTFRARAAADRAAADRAATEEAPTRHRPSRGHPAG